MGLADAVQFVVDGLADLAEVGDGGQGHLDVRVDQLLAAGDGREIQRGLDHGVQAADVRHEACGVHALAHQVEGFLHVVGVAAARADHVRGGIVDVVEVQGRLEIRLAGA